MADPLNVIWTAESIRNLESILNYLRTKWTEREVTNFIAKLDKAISLISTRPNLFRLTKYRQQIRKCVLTKQTSIYYAVGRSEIKIISLFDNRQNPDKLK